jgi:hypothetical protein
MLLVSNRYFQLKVNAAPTNHYGPQDAFVDAMWHMTSREAAFPGRVLLWDIATLSPAFHGHGGIGRDATPTRDGVIFSSTGDFAVTFQATDNMWTWIWKMPTTRARFCGLWLKHCTIR